MKKSILFFILFVNAISIWAQEVSISGVVTDVSSGEFIPGVNIYVEGTQSGTITDINGNYKITASAGSVLVYSFIGYNVQKVTVGPQSIINVSLESDIELMDEVVVVGYGSMKKSDLTGAVVSLSEELMNQTTNTSITQGLQGRMAGVQVTSSEGSPGGGMNFQIRGASSLNANSQPLYVIDGVPIEVDPLDIDDGISGSTESPISNINPSNIESIEILKDASATAIYGSRGANGVVMITTKTGKVGKPVVSVDASYGVQQVTKTLDVLNSQEYAKFMFGRADEDDKALYANWQSYSDSTNTDWQDAMYDVGKIQNYNVNLSGGTETTRYMVGGGYFSHEGLIGGNTFERYSSDFRLNQELSKKASLDFKLSVGQTTNDGVSTGGSSTPKNAGLIRQILRSPPTRELYYDATTLEDEVESLNQLDNPINFRDNVTKENNTTRILGKAELKYKVIKGLLFTSRVGLNYNAVKYESFYPEDSGRGRNVKGYAQIGHQQRKGFVWENFFNYNKKIKDHKVNLMGGATIEKTFKERFETVNKDFAYGTLGTSNIGVGVEPDIPTSYKEENQLTSFLGRAQYNFKERYLLSASFRADGSSRFPKNKWGYFPSASGAWRVSEESFFKPLTSVISNLKLRASYGETGNQNIPNYTSFAQMDIANYSLNGTTVSGLANSAVGNPDLKWETTTSTDIGLEIGFANNRVALSGDYYIKKTSDMLLSVPVPITSGYSNYLKNIGSMENKGWEFSLATTNVKTDHFMWTSNFNIAFNKNKVTALGPDQEYFPVSSGNTAIDGKARVIVGQPIGIWWGFKTDGIYKSQEELDALPNGLGQGIGVWRFKDIAGAFDENGDPIPDGEIDFDNDRTIIGKAEPKHFGGFVNSFSYKNFSLDVFLSWSYGGDIYNANNWDMTDMQNTSLNRFPAVLDAWVPEDMVYVNPDTGAETVVIPANPDSNQPGYGTRNSYLIDDYIEDGSYLRLKTVTLSYNLGENLIKKVGMSDVKLYLRGENLYTWTNYSGYDPEVDMGMGTKGLAPGIDYGAYPRARTITFGVNIKL